MLLEEIKAFLRFMQHLSIYKKVDIVAYHAKMIGPRQSTTSRPHHHPTADSPDSFPKAVLQKYGMILTTAIVSKNNSIFFIGHVITYRICTSSSCH
jgi:hypothetical protein